MGKRLDVNSNGKFNAEEMSLAFEEWLGCVVSVEDIRGIFRMVCPESLESDEIEVRTIASWIYRVYQMSDSFQKSQVEIMNGGSQAPKSTQLHEVAQCRARSKDQTRTG